MAFDFQPSLWNLTKLESITLECMYVGAFLRIVNPEVLNQISYLKIIRCFDYLDPSRISDEERVRVHNQFFSMRNLKTLGIYDPWVAFLDPQKIQQWLLGSAKSLVELSIRAVREIPDAFYALDTEPLRLIQKTCLKVHQLKIDVDASQTEVSSSYLISYLNSTDMKLASADSATVKTASPFR